MTWVSRGRLRASMLDMTPLPVESCKIASIYPTRVCHYQLLQIEQVLLQQTKWNKTWPTNGRLNINQKSRKNNLSFWHYISSWCLSFIIFNTQFLHEINCLSTYAPQGVTVKWNRKNKNCLSDQWHSFSKKLEKI